MTTPTTIPCATCNRRIDVSNCGPALIAYLAQRHERCIACLQLVTCSECACCSLTAAVTATAARQRCDYCAHTVIATNQFARG